MMDKDAIEGPSELLRVFIAVTSALLLARGGDYITSVGGEAQKVDSGRDEGGVPATEVDGWGEEMEAGEDIYTSWMNKNECEVEGGGQCSVHVLELRLKVETYK